MDIIEKVATSYAPTKYSKYIFNITDTYEEIASRYNTSIKLLANINNINGNLPRYIKDTPQLIQNSQNYILVPLIGNGGNQSTPDYYYIDKQQSAGPTRYASSSSTLLGSGGGVTLIINGVGFAIPCYPNSLSDSYNVTFNSASLFTSTEPYFVFNYSGPRTVNVSFQLHREMRGIDNDGYIDAIAAAIEAATYPVNDGWMGSEVILIVGAEIYIRGIIGGNVSVSYSGPIIDGRHNLLDVSFSINEVTGGNQNFGSKLGVNI